MYTDFFGLRAKPFDLLPNPDFLYQSKSLKRAMTYLDYGIKARSGFILITGEIGTGKTTIIRDLIKKKIPGVVLSKVFNTKVSSEQLISMINEDFGLPVQGKDKIELLRDLNEFLIDQFARGLLPVLIIDEAQNLSRELLEEVRMLSNLETDQAKLLQIILVGQPELKRTLANPDMLQLRQRININCHVQPLTEEETREYILYRLEKAGNRHAVEFAPEAVALIHAQSRGVPRLINIICDFFMLSLFSSETRVMDGPTAMEIVKELDFEEQFWETRSGRTDKGGGEERAGGGNRLNEAKTKLYRLLQDITRRILLLEKASAKCNESMFLELADRVSAMEQTLARLTGELNLPPAQDAPRSVEREGANPASPEERAEEHPPQPLESGQPSNDPPQRADADKVVAAENKVPETPRIQPEPLRLKRPRDAAREDESLFVLEEDRAGEQPQPLESGHPPDGLSPQAATDEAVAAKNKVLETPRVQPEPLRLKRPRDEASEEGLISIKEEDRGSLVSKLFSRRIFGK
jgi:general secretion pathway protein A